MTDIELQNALEMFRAVERGEGSFQVDGTSALAAKMVEGLEELRNWRATGLVEKLLGGYRGGAVSENPYIDEDDLIGLGLLARTTYDPAVHSDPNDYGVEAGDDHVVLTPVSAALLGGR